MVMIQKKPEPIKAEAVVEQAPSVIKDKVLSRRHHGKIGCCLFILLFFLAMAGGLVWFTAASGLVTVPVVSNWAYKAPTPLHAVAAGAPLETYLSENFNTLVTQRLQSGGGSLADRSVEMSLPEASITNSFRSILEQNNLVWLNAAAAQVAINNEGVEVFLPLTIQPNNNALVLFLDLGAENGLITLKSVRISLGSLTVPTWLTEIIFVPLLQQGLGHVNQQIGRYITVDKIEAAEGQLVVSGTLTVAIMRLE